MCFCLGKGFPISSQDGFESKLRAKQQVDAFCDVSSSTSELGVAVAPRVILGDFNSWRNAGAHLVLSQRGYQDSPRKSRELKLLSSIVHEHNSFGILLRVHHFNQSECQFQHPPLAPPSLSPDLPCLSFRKPPATRQKAGSMDSPPSQASARDRFGDDSWRGS